jgi:hypothetical protein
LIGSGKSGRAISQTLGIGMPMIRQYCCRIHGKIDTHSRLAIGLWAIRNGMVKSVAAVQVVSSTCGGVRWEALTAFRETGNLIAATPLSHLLGEGFTHPHYLDPAVSVGPESDQKFWRFEYIGVG